MIRRSPAVAGSLILLVGTIGCEVRLVCTTCSAPAPVRNPTLHGPYHAYGDSITAGYTLSDPETQAYPALVAGYEEVSLSNYARSGDQACDVLTKQIFSNADSPTLATHPEYTLLIGTNDVDVKGVGAYESVYILCHQASISWLAVPAEYKVLATNRAVTTTGPGMIDTTDNWFSWNTAGMGATVSFPITTVTDGPIYAWVRIDDDNAATYSYSLDGTGIGTGTVQTAVPIATQNGSTNSLGFLRIPAVAAGPHVVTFTQTSPGLAGVEVVGVGRPAGQSSDQLPTVLVGTIPYQLKGGSEGACTSSDAPCLEYIKDIQSDVTLFATDGLNVRLFDTRKYMMGTAAEMHDGVHPNAAGQVELSYSVEAVW